MPIDLGLYVHIPFCLSKCSYCHFASGVFPRSLMEPYLKAVRREMAGLSTRLREWNAATDPVSDCPVDTVFLGGGTPSLLDGSAVDQVLGWVEDFFALAPAREVTLEANPGTLTADTLEGYRAAGVNRISLGVQTFQDRLLKKVGRTHSASDSLSTAGLCRRQGVENLNLDLIAGLPGQTGEDWRENLSQVKAVSPEHLSLYLLEVHDDAHLGKPGVLPDLELPDEDLVAQWYEDSVDCLETAGWQQYEISNFCKPGRQSRHNLKYWTDQPFIGFGCGAHSYWGGMRWGNERDPYRYVERLEHQEHAVDFRSVITPRQHLEEVMFLGLRLNTGLDLSRCRRIFGFDLLERFRRELSRLTRERLVEVEEGHLKLTRKGRLFSNEVFVRFMQ